MEKFQISLQNNYESSDVCHCMIVDNERVWDTTAPAVFNVILQSIILQEDPRLSEEHRVLQEKRTVVLLQIPITAYFR